MSVWQSSTWRSARPRLRSSCATRALGLRYHLPAAHYYLGVARVMLHDVDGAIAAYETALSQNPNFPEAHTRLARIYSRSPRDMVRAAMHRAQAAEIREGASAAGQIARNSGNAGPSYHRLPGTLALVAARRSRGPDCCPFRNRRLPTSRRCAIRDARSKRHGDRRVRSSAIGHLDDDADAHSRRRSPADRRRAQSADENNPHGYLELTKAKQLQQRK
jgi:tetratricopeptide (TPR) repeat protein